jgi:hypothetical protein
MCVQLEKASLRNKNIPCYKTSGTDKVLLRKFTNYSASPFLFLLRKHNEEKRVLKMSVILK